MSLFISEMNLSVILFPPANLCPSSLRAHLSSLDQTQWRELLPKSFQHQPFSLLRGEEVTSGSSPVAPEPRGHCGTSKRRPGLQWSCPGALVSRSGTVRWKGSCGVPWTHRHGLNPGMGCKEVSDGIPRTDRFHVEFHTGLGCMVLPWGWKQLFNAKNPWDMRVILKFQDSFSDSTTLIHQFNPYTAWTHPTGTPSFKKTKLISSQYFAFNSQLLLSRLQGYSSLTLSPARDFLLWFLGKPAVEIRD